MEINTFLENYKVGDRLRCFKYDSNETENYNKEYSNDEMQDLVGKIFTITKMFRLPDDNGMGLITDCGELKETIYLEVRLNHYNSMAELTERWGYSKVAE